MIEGLRPRAREREAVEARRLAAREREDIFGLVEAGQLLVLPVLVHGEQALVVGGGVQVELGVAPLVRVVLADAQHRLGHAAPARRTVRVSSSGTQARVADKLRRRQGGAGLGAPPPAARDAQVGDVGTLLRATLRAPLGDGARVALRLARVRERDARTVARETRHGSVGMRMSPGTLPSSGWVESSATATILQLSASCATSTSEQGGCICHVPPESSRRPRRSLVV